MDFFDNPPPIDAVTLHALQVAAISFAVCALITAVSPGQSLDARSRVTSTLHAIYVTFLSARCLWNLYPTMVEGDAAALWLGTDHESVTAVSITGGYLLCDVAMHFLVDRTLLDTSMLFHHLVGIWCAFCGVVLHFGAPLQAIYLINEASTPFVNIHHTSGWKDWRKAANGVCMWLAFLIFRLVVNSFVCYVVVGTGYYGWEVVKPHAFEFFTQVTLASGLQVLNVWWFYRITRLLVRHLRGSTATAAPEAAAPAAAAAPVSSKVAEKVVSAEPTAASASAEEPTVSASSAAEGVADAAPSSGGARKRKLQA